MIVPGAHADDDALRVVGAESDAGGLDVRVIVDGPVPAAPVIVAVHGVVLRRPAHRVPRCGHRAVGTGHGDVRDAPRHPLLSKGVVRPDDEERYC